MLRIAMVLKHGLFVFDLKSLNYFVQYNRDKSQIVLGMNYNTFNYRKFSSKRIGLTVGSITSNKNLW